MVSMSIRIQALSLRWSVGLLGSLAPWLLGCCLAGGCQRLDTERTLNLEPTQSHALLFDAPRSEQQVSVTIHSPGAPVEVYVVLEKNREQAMQTLEQGRRPAKEQLLASKDKAEEATLETTVPARNAFAVLLNSKASKAAQVKVKVTGR